MVLRSLRPLWLATLLLAITAPADAQSLKDYTLQEIHKCQGESSWIYGKPSQTAVICERPDVPSLRYIQYTQHPRTSGYRRHWGLSIIPQETTGHHLFVLTTSDRGDAPYNVLYTKWVPGVVELQEIIPNSASHVELTKQFMQTHAAEFQQFAKYYDRWYRSYFPQPGAKQDCWAKAAKGEANPLDCAEAEGLLIN